MPKQSVSHIILSKLWLFSLKYVSFTTTVINSPFHGGSGGVPAIFDFPYYSRDALTLQIPRAVVLSTILIQMLITFLLRKILNFCIIHCNDAFLLINPY